jgi:Clostripain family
VSSESPSTKPWAVLAYTVADDRSGGTALDTAAKNELKALCDAADFDQVTIAAQVDFKHTRGVHRGVLSEKPRDFEEIAPESHPLWRSIVGAIKRSKLRVLLEKQDLNAARADVLLDFLRFGQRECHADRYVIAFYGHAYGPMGLFYDAAAGQRDATTLRLNDLAGAIEAAERKATVIVFRDCFMSTLETAYQLRNAAEFMIASQSVVPVAGVWPWLGFMAALMPGAASGDVARAIAVQLAHFLDTPANRGPFADVPYSLIDLGAADEVVAPLKALTDALDAAREDPKRVAACAGALEGARVGLPDDAANPGDPALVDVPTLCDRLQALAGDPVAAPAAALGDVVRNRLVRWAHSQKDAHRGVSLYYHPVTPRDIERSFLVSADPDDAARDAVHYAQLALCEATGWNRIALKPLTPA